MTHYATELQHDIPAKVDATLTTILSWPRPHNTPAERGFAKWLAEQIKTLGYDVERWEEDCLYMTLTGDNGQKPTVLFSCHIDTVDFDRAGAANKDGAVDVKKLTYDPNFGLIGVDSANEVGSCLGADDGAGIWLMLEMIKAKVPGGYIFHRGEERGGIGARAVLAKRAAQLALFDIAVAFDRPDTYEVITHQGGLECASDKFAVALCKELNSHGMRYSPSAKGVFTDTKVYRGVIAECTNLGVGYTDQHSKMETQDYGHLCAMRDALIAIKWDSLPVDRDCKKVDVYTGRSGRNNYQGYGGPVYGRQLGGFDGLDDEDLYQRQGFGMVGGYPQKPQTPPQQTGKKKKPNLPSPFPKVAEPELALWEEFAAYSLEEMTEVVEDDSELAVRAICKMLQRIKHLEADVKLLSALSGVDLDD